MSRLTGSTVAEYRRRGTTETCPLCGVPLVTSARRGTYRGAPAHALCALQQTVDDQGEELDRLKATVSGLVARERV